MFSFRPLKKINIARFDCALEALRTSAFDFASFCVFKLCPDNIIEVYRLVFCCYYVMYRLCTVMLNLSYFTLIPSQFEFTLPKNCTILHTIVYYTEQNSHQLLWGGKGQNEYCTVYNINAYSVQYSVTFRKVFADSSY